MQGPSAIIHHHLVVTGYLYARPNQAQLTHTAIGIYEILGAEGVIMKEIESDLVWMEQMVTDLAV
jgi:hypothetical protein